MDKYLVLNEGGLMGQRVIDGKVYLCVEAHSDNLKTAIALSIKTGQVLPIYKQIEWEVKESK